MGWAATAAIVLYAGHIGNSGGGDDGMATVAANEYKSLATVLRTSLTHPDMTTMKSMMFHGFRK